MAGKCEGHCEDHSGHEAILEQHEKRHGHHDQSFKDLWEALKHKVSRWVFILLFTVVCGVFGFQLKVLMIVTSIDKNVAVLNAQFNGHKNGDTETAYIKTRVTTCHTSERSQKL